MKAGWIALGLLNMSLAGCASAMKRDLQRVDVITDPPGATVSVAGQTLISPGSLTIGSDRDAVEVRIEKEGYAPRTVTLVRHRNGRFLARLAFIPIVSNLASPLTPNVLGGGLPGYATGGTFLAATGYIRDPREVVPAPFAPEEIVVRLEPLARPPVR